MSKPPAMPDPLLPVDPTLAHLSGQGHPRGLYTLFFTEMWERLSYYGLRALFVLFLTAQVQKGGMGLDDKIATAIYGLYTAGVYLAALPGGWIADRLIGAQRAVWFGGILIASGHFCMGVPTTQTFFLGLVLIVVGTGLLKPNISALVGQIYPEGGARRDAGFTIFYMGINLGAALGPMVCGSLGQKVDWHYGFTAAGVGMVLGLIQFRATRVHLGAVGLEPGHRSVSMKRDWGLVSAALGVLVLVIVLAMSGVLVINPVKLGETTAWVILAMAVGYFVWAFRFAKLDTTEKKRVAVIAILFLAATMFWSGFEQAGSSLNLFGDRNTQRIVPAGTLGLEKPYEVPASWFQSLNAIFVITLAPVVAALWTFLARRNASPSLTVKVSWGLLLLAAGFLVLAIGANRAISIGPVWPTWLIATYFLHTVGELFLSPVGLSAVTKLAPPRLVGQMMGIWFLGASLGNLVAGLFAGEVSGDNTAEMPRRFMQVVMTAGGAGLLLLLFTKPIRKLMAGVK